ncbi:MAG: hypothetical protein ABR564_03075 [Candidatus Dormibacteria bacterium]
MTFTIVVTGPAGYRAACEGPAQLLITDTAADLHVYSGTSAPGVPGDCGDVLLPQGQRHVYSISWRPEPTLPGGDYSAVVLLGDQAAVTLPLVVEAGVERAIRCG